MKKNPFFQNGFDLRAKIKTTINFLIIFVNFHFRN